MSCFGLQTSVVLTLLPFSHSQAEQSTYALFESGKGKPNIDVLIATAKHFRVTFDFLLRLNNSSKPENANITETIGLSEKSVEILKGCLKLDKQNSITLTINAFLIFQVMQIAQKPSAEKQTAFNLIFFNVPEAVAQLLFCDGPFSRNLRTLIRSLVWI